MKAILKALLKPRPLIGIFAMVIVLWIAGLVGVSLWWSIPAALWWAEAVGFIYKTIKKDLNT